MRSMVPGFKSEVRRLPRSAGPWVLSIIVHLFILVHFVGPIVATQAPEGVWVEIASSDAPRARHQHDRKTSKLPSDVVTKEKDETAKEKATPLGNAEKSTGISGPLGELNGTQTSIRDRYLYELEAFINQYKTYPPRARYLGLTGRVEVAFHLEMDGSIKDPHVVKPCLHDLLNEAAVNLVLRAGKFRPIPPELATHVLHVTVPIEYELK